MEFSLPVQNMNSAPLDTWNVSGHVERIRNSSFLLLAVRCLSEDREIAWREKGIRGLVNHDILQMKQRKQQGIEHRTYHTVELTFILHLDFSESICKICCIIRKFWQNVFHLKWFFNSEY